MRLAMISDIHGHLAALEAVLLDIAVHDADVTVLESTVPGFEGPLEGASA